MRDDKITRPASGLGGLAVLGLAIPALVWMAFGIVAFVQIHRWGEEYDRKLAMIERGEVKPDSLRVLDLAYDKGEGRWNVSLGKDGKALAWRSTNNVDGIAAGSEMAAYRFGEEFLIPQLDRGGFHWGKWVFLGFGMLPLPVLALVGLVKLLRRGPYGNAGDSGRPRVQPPRAFSRAHLEFPGDVDDSQLVGLLGDRDCGPVRAIEEAGMLIVRPWLFPMKWVTAWMVFVALSITVLIFVVPPMLHDPLDLRSPLPWLFLAFLWGMVLPAFLGILFAINHTFAAKGDFFRVDLSRRTLELCRAGRTFNASQIAAITHLSRWYRDPTGTWSRTYQAGVLVRAAGGGMEFHLLARHLGDDMSIFSREAQWVQRLAEIFQTPLRRIELSRSESRALNDC